MLSEIVGEEGWGHDGLPQLQKERSGEALLQSPGTVHQASWEETTLPTSRVISASATFPGWLYVQEGHMTNSLICFRFCHRKLKEFKEQPTPLNGKVNLKTAQERRPEELGNLWLGL